MLMKNKLKIMVANAKRFTNAAFSGPQLGVARACRYAAYRTHVINDTASFGSHPQNRPHADSAQMAPNLTPRPKVGRAAIADRYARAASLSADGSGRTRNDRNLRLDFSSHTRNK